MAIWIIPAYAGSTCGGLIHARTQQDHPRIRGEHAAHGPEIRGRRGSSPHTRGARRQCRLHDEIPRIIPAYAGSTPLEACEGIGPRGIIPAYAGSTAFAKLREAVAEDHPRIRGEHCLYVVLDHVRRGSSPHTRGALDWSGVCFVASRIIPAYAGSTHRQRPAHAGDEDHPRIRGEHGPSR